MSSMTEALRLAAEAGITAKVIPKPTPGTEPGLSSTEAFCGPLDTKAILDFDAIPPALKSRPQWLLWSLEERGGKHTKIPRHATPDGLRNAKSTDPKTWRDFETIRADFERWKGHGISGIGFVFTDSDPFVGIDVDDVRDPDTGEWERGRLEEAESFGSYAELSQSGKGVHVIVEGEKPGSKCRRGAVEIYQSGRFFVMTGNRIEGTPDDVKTAAPGSLEAFYRQIEPESAPITTPTKKSPQNVSKTVLSDSEVIRRARGAENGPKFSRLFGGDTSGYESQSEADIALCNILAFWTRDAGQIDRIFRDSALYRPKWDTNHGRGTYGEITIDNALARVTEWYGGGRAAPVRAPAVLPISEADTDLAARCLQCNTTDTGNGDRFAIRYAGEVVFCNTRSAWYRYENGVWRVDQTNQLMEMAKAVAVAINLETAIEPNDARRTKLRKFADDSESQYRLKAMLDSASSMPGIAVLPDAFDADPDLFNLKNGTFNLRTHQLQPHRRDDRLTKMAGVEYDPGADCPKWKAHLELIFDGDEDLIASTQELLGYAMLAGNPDQIFPIWWGDGQNGKSVTISVVRSIYGDYAVSVEPSTFMDVAKDGGPRPDLLALRGARFASAIEGRKGQRLNEPLIKQMSGGDPLTARGLYQAPETFKPSHLAVLVTNPKPIISGVDYAIWRRVLMWPFAVTIPEERKIPDYENVLLEESAGIFNWMVEGLRRYQERGKLKIPAKVHAATEQYRSDMDILAPFLRYRCVVAPGEIVDRKTLYEEYRDFCEKNDEETMNTRQFASALKDRNVTDGGAVKGRRRWRGIRLKTVAEMKADEEAGSAQERL